MAAVQGGSGLNTNGHGEGCRCPGCLMNNDDDSSPVATEETDGTGEGVQNSGPTAGKLTRDAFDASDCANKLTQTAETYDDHLAAADAHGEAYQAHADAADKLAEGRDEDEQPGSLENQHRQRMQDHLQAGASHWQKAQSAQRAPVAGEQYPAMATNLTANSWTAEAREAAAEARKKSGEAHAAYKSMSAKERFGSTIHSQRASGLGKRADTPSEHMEAAAAHISEARRGLRYSGPGTKAIRDAGGKHLDAAEAHLDAAKLKGAGKSGVTSLRKTIVGIRSGDPNAQLFNSRDSVSGLEGNPAMATNEKDALGHGSNKNGEVDRGKLRKIQDRLLAHPDVKSFVKEHGENKPLWEGGPSHTALKQFIHPAHQSHIEAYLAQHPVHNRDWPQAKRDKTPAEDFAGPDQSFPITSQADVDAAAHLVGKATNPKAVKAKIMAIAKRKGLKIPEAWVENSNPEDRNQYTAGGRTAEQHAKSESTHNQQEGGPTMAKLSDEERGAIVDGLITNCEGCGWSEEDRDTLNSLSDVTLNSLKEQTAIVANAKKKKDEKDDDDEDEDEDEDEETTDNADVEAWLAKAPVAVQNTVRYAQRLEQRERDGLISKIVTNLEGQQKVRVLNRLSGKSLDELQDLAALAPKPVKVRNSVLDQGPIYLGAAAPVSNRSGGSNLQGDHTDPIPPSIMDYTAPVGNGHK
jgi:hypothetical protein